MKLITLLMWLLIVLGSHWAGADARPGPGMPAETLSLSEVRRVVEGRYEGRILRVRVDTPRYHERRAGATAIYEIVLLTLQEAVIRIRLDAQAGEFLTVEGVGQVEARRRE